MKTISTLAIGLALATVVTPAAANTFKSFERSIRGQLKDIRSLQKVVKSISALPKHEQDVIIRSLRIDPRIIGGTLVPIANHHWQVALVKGYTDGRYQFCGGALIAPDTVLTAAHCIDNPLVQNDPARLDIVAGTSVYPENGERLEVKALSVHPKWNSTRFDYDVAIIKLASPSTLGKPIAITPEPAGAGTSAWVTGWGLLSEGGRSSEELMGTTLPIVDTTICNSAESYDGAISPQMMCAGVREGGLDSCQGDSGGPLTQGEGATARLIGIVSWGKGCGRKLKYGVYARLSELHDWIASQTDP